MLAANLILTDFNLLERILFENRNYIIITQFLESLITLLYIILIIRFNCFVPIVALANLVDGDLKILIKL